MELLIDTNVILDMVLKRNGCDSSMELFRKVRETGAGAYITASSVTDIFYILRKTMHDTNKTYIVMENIFRLVMVMAVTEKDIHDAFGQRWKDFEDCVQYMTGKNNRVDYIITANLKDYAETSLPVMTPEEWVQMIVDSQENR